MIYIGSAQGDPCIAQIQHDSRTGKYTLNIIKSFSNLGPIVDFCLFDYDQQGKKTMVCCSGVGKDGSLRIVENGIGFLEKFHVKIPLITNVWSLKNSKGINDMMIVSTCYSTIVLQQKSAMEIKEHRQSELTLNEPTLALASSKEGYIVQVTPSGVKIVTYGATVGVVGEWEPPGGETIALAATNESQCIVCLDRGTLVYFQCTKAGLYKRGYVYILMP
jgi:DNA damage-binding protein 1